MFVCVVMCLCLNLYMGGGIGGEIRGGIGGEQPQVRGGG